MLLSFQKPEAWHSCRENIFLGGLAFALVFLFLSTSVLAQDSPPEEEAEGKSSESYIPVDLDDGIRHLKETLSSEDIEVLRSTDEGELARFHFGLGLSLRNGWGLWGGSRLAEWFNSIGIFHPDDMSGIIITSLVRDLKGEPIELDAQVAEYQAYWAEAEEYERREELEAVERQGRREEARLNWEWIPGSAFEVTLPRQPDWHDIWGLHAYDGGFLVVTKRYRRSYNPIWHDGVYFLDSPNGLLERVEVSGCLYQYDVIVRNDAAIWLCRAHDGDWTLVTTGSGEADAPRNVTLNAEHDWLRLGHGETGLLLVGADRIYREDGEDWDVIYQAPSATRDFNLFDQDRDFDADENPEPFLPQRSATPIEHGGYVYFHVEDSGNGTDLYRLALSDDKGDLENAQTFIARRYLGNWGFRVGDIGIDEDGTLWITSHSTGALFSVEPNGDVGIAAIFHNLSFDKPIDELERPDDWRDKLPAGAILHDDGSILLAGVDGIARVTDGAVEPVVRFVYPDGMDREPYTSRPQYDYHVKPQRLGMFEDGSFVIGDRYDGVYVLIKDEDGYRISFPPVAQSTREIVR